MGDSPDELRQLQNQIVAIKEKHVPVINAYLLKAREVVKEVATRLGEPFNMHHHFTASVRYKVRKEGKFDAAG